jgi:hypothetical protein
MMPALASVLIDEMNDRFSLSPSGGNREKMK